MKFFFFNDFYTFQIWFVVMICLWLGFAVMILIWFQLWFWYGFSYVFWCGSNLWFEANPQKIFKIVSKPYQNRIKIKSKHKNLRKIDQKPVPRLFLFLFLKPTHWNHIKTVSKSYQKRIKIVTKSYQNRIKTISIKTLENSTKNLSLGCFCFFVWSQLTGTISKPYQINIKIVSKSQQNPYRNHNPKFKAYQIHIVKSYPKPY